MVARWLLPVTGVLALACSAPSESEVQEEFQEFVSANNECSDDADCTVVFPECPLGCAVAVNSAARAAVQQKAKELIREYEQGGRSCAYQCLAAEARCSSSARCEIVIE